MQNVIFMLQPDAVRHWLGTGRQRASSMIGTQYLKLRAESQCRRKAGFFTIRQDGGVACAQALGTVAGQTGADWSSILALQCLEHFRGEGTDGRMLQGRGCKNDMGWVYRLHARRHSANEAFN